MQEKSTVKLTLTLSDSELDNEELDEETRKLLWDINELNEVEKATFVEMKEAPEGAKALAGTLIGVLKVVLSSAQNLKDFFDFLIERVKSKRTEITLKVSDGEKKFSLKVSASNQDKLAEIVKALTEIAKHN